MTREQLNEILGSADLYKVASIVPEEQMAGARKLPREVPTEGKKTLTRVKFPHKGPTATENIAVKKLPKETDNTLVKKAAIYEKLEEASGIDIASLTDEGTLTKIAEEHIANGEQMLYKEAEAIANFLADTFIERIESHG